MVAVPGAGRPVRGFRSQCIRNLFMVLNRHVPAQGGKARLVGHQLGQRHILFSVGGKCRPE